jgi:hypothetical protein
MKDPQIHEVPRVHEGSSKTWRIHKYMKDPQIYQLKDPQIQGELANTRRILKGSNTWKIFDGSKNIKDPQKLKYIRDPQKTEHRKDHYKQEGSSNTGGTLEQWIDPWIPNSAITFLRWFLFHWVQNWFSKRSSWFQSNEHMCQMIFFRLMMTVTMKISKEFPYVVTNIHPTHCQSPTYTFFCLFL